MINDDNKSEIKVVKFLWRQKLLIAGHYEFEIVLRNVNRISEKTIYRRFSDIEWLHEGLKKYNPGCRIPNLPSKNIWMNLNVNNSINLEKRAKHIEDNLNYISNHKHLRESEVFKIFYSDDFEFNKVDHEKKSTLYEKFTNFTQILPFRTNKIGLTKIEDNQKLDKDRENLVRLLKATKDLNANMKEYVKTNEEQTDAIKSIVISTKKIQYTSLDYNFHNLQDDDHESKSDKSISKNLEIINNFYEHNKIFSSKVSCSICDQLENYESELQQIIEIFERKREEEEKLEDLLSRERDDAAERDIELQKNHLHNLNQQLIDEITNFKIFREIDLLKIISNFIRNKADCNKEISHIFD